MTTVGSFLKHHPRFDGDVVIVHDGLSPEQWGYLEALSDRVRLEPLSPALRELLLHLQPRLRSPKLLAQLYVLDIFRLTDYRKVLFCDADLLFRQPIDELFDTDVDLLCCGDHAHFEGRGRNPATYAATDAAGALERPFRVQQRIPGHRRTVDR